MFLLQQCQVTNQLNEIIYRCSGILGFLQRTPELPGRLGPVPISKSDGRQEYLAFLGFWLHSGGVHE